MVCCRVAPSVIWTNVDFSYVRWQSSESNFAASYEANTHSGRVTHICVRKLSIIGSENGLSPGPRQAIIWTNVGLLLIGTIGTNLSEILIKIATFLFKKMPSKISSANWRPLYLTSMCQHHTCTITMTGQDRYCSAASNMYTTSCFTKNANSAESTFLWRYSIKKVFGCIKVILDIFLLIHVLIDELI